MFIDSTDVKNAKKVLVDNGIAEDEAETVLQAVGYALLDEELFPENESSGTTTKTSATKREFLSHMTELFDIASDFKDIMCDVINDIQKRDGLRDQLREKKRKEHGFSSSANDCKSEEQTPVFYMVSNTTNIGEYTPSVFYNLNDAIEWLQECSIENFIAGFCGGRHPIMFDGREVNNEKRDEYGYMKKNHLVKRFINEVVNVWEHADGKCFINDASSEICYNDGSFNHMQIYAVYASTNEKDEPMIRAVLPVK